MRMYVCTNFDGCSYVSFKVFTVIHKIFILKISFTKLWLASDGEQDAHEQLCLILAMGWWLANPMHHC